MPSQTDRKWSCNCSSIFVHLLPSKSAVRQISAFVVVKWQQDLNKCLSLFHSAHSESMNSCLTIK